MLDLYPKTRSSFSFLRNFIRAPDQSELDKKLPTRPSPTCTELHLTMVVKIEEHVMTMTRANAAICAPISGSYIIITNYSFPSSPITAIRFSKYNEVLCTLRLYLYVSCCNYVTRGR